MNLLDHSFSDLAGVEGEPGKGAVSAQLTLPTLWRGLALPLSQGSGKDLVGSQVEALLRLLLVTWGWAGGLAGCHLPTCLSLPPPGVKAVSSGQSLLSSPERELRIDLALGPFSVQILVQHLTSASVAKFPFLSLLLVFIFAFLSLKSPSAVKWALRLLTRGLMESARKRSQCGNTVDEPPGAAHTKVPGPHKPRINVPLPCVCVKPEVSQDLTVKTNL